MTEYTVRAGGGGGGGTLPTLAAAVAIARPGDVFHVEAGVYGGVFKPTTDTTWIGQPGAVIGGGWNGTSPGTKDGATVLIREAGVTLRGFDIRNCPAHGVGINAGGDGAVIENCTITNCFRGGVIVNGMGTMVTNITFRNVHVRHVVLSWAISPTMQGAGCWAMRWADGVVVKNCTLAGGHGEGIAAGIQSRNIVIDGSVFHSTGHLVAYAANRAQNVIMRDCVLYQTGDAAYLQSDGDVGGLLVIGDETRADDKDDKWRHAENILIERCLCVGGSKLLDIRNNLKPVDGAPAGQYDGYETRVENLVIRDCTFVSTDLTGTAVVIQENPIGHRLAGEISRCVFVTDRSRKGGPAAIRNSAAEVKFKDCRFTHLPGGAGASNQSIDAAALVNALAEVGGTADAPVFSIDNYRPAAGGSLVGADGWALAGALEPLGVEPPPPPPPPPPDPDPTPGPDWDALRVMVTTAAMRLAAAQANVTEAQRHTDGAAAALNLAMLRLADAQQGQADAAAEMAALLAKMNEYKSAA